MELKDYYEALQAMFVTEGWKVFKEDMERDLGKTSSIDGVDSVESLFFKKGQMHVLKNHLNYEQYVEQGLEELDADNS